MRDKERRYSDREIRSILQLALEIEKGEKPGGPASQGLSRGEIQSVAQEAGISAGAIRGAIAEYESRRSAGAARVVLGGPLHIVEAFTFDRALNAAESERLNARIRSLESLRKVEPALGLGSSGLTVDVAETDRGTEVRITDRLYPAAGGLFGGIIGGLGFGGGLGIGLGVGIGALGSPVFAALVPLGFIAAAYALARGVYRGVVRARRRVVGRLMEKIQADVDLPPR